jgi:hypothetical protein
MEALALRRVELPVDVEEGELPLAGTDDAARARGDVVHTRDGEKLADRHERQDASRGLFRSYRRCYAPAVATILLAGVDVYFRGKLDALLAARHRLVTTDSIDPPDLVIVDIARVDPYEVAEAYPDVPILGFTNHTDTAGLRAAQAAGLDRVVVRSALAERAPQLVEELVA